MAQAARHLDRRITALRTVADAARPPRGWLRAVRETLGMTTVQMARRMGVSQPRIVELERAEVDGSVSLKTLQRAAEALGCRVAYVLVPEKPFERTLRERAEAAADRRLALVDQTMRLEDQAVHDKRQRAETRRKLVGDLLERPAQLWDDV